MSIIRPVKPLYLVCCTTNRHQKLRHGCLRIQDLLAPLGIAIGGELGPPVLPQTCSSRPLAAWPFAAAWHVTATVTVAIVAAFVSQIHYAYKKLCSRDLAQGPWWVCHRCFKMFHVWKCNMKSKSWESHIVSLITYSKIGYLDLILRFLVISRTPRKWSIS